jgi:hypothetical protein
MQGSVHMESQVKSGGVLHPIIYMATRGLFYGVMFGVLYFVLLSPFAPLLGVFVGLYLGGLAGLPTGIVLGLIIYVISISSLPTRPDYRKTLLVICGMTGFGVMLAGAIIYLYLRSLVSDDGLFDGFFGIVAIIPALIAAFCSAYVSNNYAKRYFEDNSH